VSISRMMKATVCFWFTGKLNHLSPSWVFTFQVKYVDDDSTIFWAVGPDQSVLATRVEHCGKDVELTIPLESATSGEVIQHSFFAPYSSWRGIWRPFHQ